MSNQHVLVVDDDRAVVRLLRAYLEQAGFAVQVAYNGETALQIMRRERPDLVLLDLMLPDRDGWDITRIIRADPRLATMPLIMLTARVTDADKIVGLEVGADDYITKPYNPREVVARVRARLRIEAGLSRPNARPVLRVGSLELDVQARQVTADGDAIELTATEFELLRVLMKHPGYVWSRGELIRAALGNEFDGIERTVDSHVRNLRRKIEPDPRHPSWIETVYGVGYRLVPPEEAA